MELLKYQEFMKGAGELKSSNSVALKIVSLLALSMMLGGILSHSSSVLLWFIGQVILGINILQCFFILHDLGHEKFFSNPKLNSFFGILFSLVVMIPFFPWKYIHRSHHLWTGYKDKDPTQSLTSSREISSFKVWFINICWKFWIPVCSVSFSLSNFWNFKKLYKLYPQFFLKNIFSMFMIIIVHILVFWSAGGKAYFHYFGLSYTIFLVLSDPLLLSQHSSKKQMLSRGEKVSMVHFKDQEHFTRGLNFPRWAEKIILLGFNRHILHHLHPSLPGYLLNELSDYEYNSENWLDWLTWAKKTPGYDLVLSEANNLLDEYQNAERKVNSINS